MFHSLIRIISILILVVSATIVQAQTIRLDNPSFEDEPAAGSTPIGWRNCGNPGETPPDTQPNATFRVYKKAQKGDTYLGLVTRDTDTWESVGQSLETPLIGGECYDFSVYLARSESYLSRRRVDTVQTQFTQPIRLRIWGGNNYCDKRELLAETDVIEHTKWKEYDFKFKPRREYNFIMLEAFYMTPTLVAYNGNILVDNCSAITIASCGDDDPAIAQAKPKPRNENIAPKPKDKPKDRREKTKEKEKPKAKEKEKSETKPAVTGKIDLPKPVEKPIEKPKEELVEEVKKEEKKEDPTVKPKVKEKPTTPKITTIEKLDESDIEEGQIIRIDKLNFPANSSVITKSTYEVLDKIYDFLSRNGYIVVEIGGHTNNVPDDIYCDKLSRERAESVGAYLAEKGIDPKRITAKGYGKKQPIATNETLAGRKQNQRVEIKVISVGK